MRRILLPLAVLAALALGWWTITPAAEALVVYCAHDARYAEPILRRFEAESGIPLVIRYDTEATKSLALTEQIRAEADDPRCDVFWNNQELGTASLAADGLLVPYESPHAAAIPAWAKDPEHRYTGFAARLRVWIYNEAKLAELGLAPDGSELGVVLQKHPGLVAVARPLYGTTRTHLTALVDAWGLEAAIEWWTTLLERGASELAGNAQVAEAVAAGGFAMGLTDTDDFFAMLDRGAPVGFRAVEIFGAGLPDVSGRTADFDPEDAAFRRLLQHGEELPSVPHRYRALLMPNTVAITRDGSMRGHAQALVDHLLSPTVQFELARSPSRQIPLGRVDAGVLPDASHGLQRIYDTMMSTHVSGKLMAVVWDRSVYQWQDRDASAAATLEWLRSR